MATFEEFSLTKVSEQFIFEQTSMKKTLEHADQSKSEKVIIEQRGLKKTLEPEDISKSDEKCTQLTQRPVVMTMCPIKKHYQNG